MLSKILKMTGLPKFIVVIKSLFSFMKLYMLKSGFLDGKAGLAVAVAGMKYESSRIQFHS
jgi:hypothetical protein